MCGVGNGGEGAKEPAVAPHFISCACINDEEGLFFLIFLFPLQASELLGKC